MSLNHYNVSVPNEYFEKDIAAQYRDAVRNEAAATYSSLPSPTHASYEIPLAFTSGQSSLFSDALQPAAYFPHPPLLPSQFGPHEGRYTVDSSFEIPVIARASQVFPSLALPFHEHGPHASTGQQPDFPTVQAEVVPTEDRRKPAGRRQRPCGTCQASKKRVCPNDLSSHVGELLMEADPVHPHQRTSLQGLR